MLHAGLSTRVASGMLVGAVALLVCGATGCGRSDGLELGAVTGTITLGGQPLDGAEISFTPENGSPSLGETDSRGRYEMRFTRSRKGVMLGPNTVRITTAIERENDRGEIVRTPERVPARYNKNTELVREVKRRRNTIDFDLETTGTIVEERL